MFKKIWIGLNILAQAFLLGGLPIAVHAETAPIISAVQITGGAGQTSDDFIELYNPSDQPFNLNGYRLVKRTATGTTDSSIKSWTTDTFIPAHSFYLWANSAFTTITAAPDLTSTATLSDNNGVALRQGAADTGVIVDSLSWGTATNGFPVVSDINPGANESLARADLFDSSLGYQIHASTPRNSTIQVLPQTAPPPVEPPPTPEPTPDPAPTPDPTPTPPPVISTTLRINELLPNPTGDDSGSEQIELYNYGTESIDLAGWIMDDVLPTDPLSSNAYTINPGTIAGQGYAVITLPAGSFAMNNTGGDAVTLFDPSGNSIDSVIYETAAPENQSYSYFDDGWQWTTPTFGLANTQPIVEPPQGDPPPVTPPPQPEPDQVPQLRVNEVYSFPAPQQTEFLELYNFGDSIINLKDITLQIGDKHKSLPDVALAPNSYFVVNGNNLPAALRNTGQSVELSDSQNHLIDSVDYPKSNRGQSYSKFEDGFLWTLVPTPGADNQLVVPEDKKPKVAGTATITQQPPKSSTANKSAASKPKSVAAQTAAIPATSEPEPEQPIVQVAKTAKKKSSTLALVFAGLGTVTIGMWLAYRYGFKEQPDFV